MKKAAQLIMVVLVAAVCEVASADFSEQESFLPDTATFSGYKVQIPMRDGKNLAGDVYLPRFAGDEKLPVIVIMTPYGKNAMFRPGYGAIPPPDQLPEAYKGMFSSGEKYVLLTVDWRGSGASKDAATITGGTVDPIPEDGYDVIEWAARQNWNNGKVGMWGPSALGMVQYHTAETRPPSLVAIVPSVHPAILTPDFFLPGGALWESFLLFLSGLGSDNTKGGDLRWDIYDTVTDIPKLLGNYREQINPSRMDVPMLMIGGWYDVYPQEMLEFFRRVQAEGGPRAKQHARLMIGPWTHGTSLPNTGELTYTDAQLADVRAASNFLDYWLHADDQAFDERLPAIQYYQMGSNEWRHTDVWPPKDMTNTAYYLQPQNSLSIEEPSATTSKSQFTFDPSDPVPTIGGQLLTRSIPHGPYDQRNEVESHDDVLIFSTPMLQDPVAVTGPVSVTAFVSTDRVDTDFSAILTDVYPDGRSMLISQGIQRMRFRNGLANEELLEPGEIYEITIEMIPTANTFLAGHQIRLVLSSSSSPKYAVNLNDGGPMYGKEATVRGVIATNHIYHDRDHPTAINLFVAPE